MVGKDSFKLTYLLIEDLEVLKVMSEARLIFTRLKSGLSFHIF